MRPKTPPSLEFISTTIPQVIDLLVRPKTKKKRKKTKKKRKKKRKTTKTEKTKKTKTKKTKKTTKKRKKQSPCCSSFPPPGLCHARALSTHGGKAPVPRARGGP